jgi:hypothetical protein
MFPFLCWREIQEVPAWVVIMMLVLAAVVIIGVSLKDDTPKPLTSKALEQITQTYLDSALTQLIEVQGGFIQFLQDAHAQVRQNPLSDAFLKHEKNAQEFATTMMQARIRYLALVNPGGGSVPDTVIVINDGSIVPGTVIEKFGGWVYIPRYQILYPNTPSTSHLRAKSLGEK